MLFGTKNGKISTALMLLLACWAFTFWGFIWYATVFDDLWQYLIGQTEEDLILLAQSRGVSQTILTYIISLIQVVGLYILQTASRSKTFMEYQARGLLVSLFIIGPALGNEVLFAGSSEKLWLFDWLHFIFGYAGISLVFWLWQKYLGGKTLSA